jgi:hypothetical protein
MQSPVVLIIFNRPDHTERVFEAIRQAKPPQLFVIADGPRPDRPGERERCAATRAIIDRVDWDCEVRKDFSDTNLSCGIRVATGISWVFEQVESAIILEDDCIPHPSFFDFCDAMLDRYRDDERIMHVSGNNFWSDEYDDREDSYLFSRYPLSWGWATWRRAWKYHDFDLKQWPEIKQKNLLNDMLGDQAAVKSWTKTLQNHVDTGLDTWDYQWNLTCWAQNGLSVLPHVNLVSNIGFGEDSTHTVSSDSASAAPSSFSVPTAAMHFPLKHPRMMVRNAEIDRFIQDRLYDYHPTLLKRVKKKLYRLLGR